MCLDAIFTAIIQTIETNKAQFTASFINNYLDKRDTKNFDNEWRSAFEYFDNIAHKSNEFLSNENNLREQIFKKVAQLTQNHELAAYLSDDGGLIYANVYFDANHKFVDYLYQCYKSDLLPSTAH